MALDVSKIDEAANMWEKTRDQKYKDLWYKLIKEWANGMFQLVPITKQMMEHMSLSVKELDLFELCDILRLKLTTYHDYPINKHVMNDGSGDFYGCIQN